MRVAYDCKTLPLNLHGLKAPEVLRSVYMARDRLAEWQAGAREPLRWIVIATHGVRDRAREGSIRTIAVPFKVTNAATEIAAVR